MYSMLKIFVAHYSKLVERKKHVIEQFHKHNITNYEFIEKYDKEDLKEEDIRKFSYDTSMPLAAVSLSLKKLHIYEEIRDKYDYALILEDDVILCNDFVSILHKYISDLPSSYDMLFLGCGLGFHIPYERIIPGNHIYRKCLYPTAWGGDGCSRGTDCYLIKKKCAKELCDYIYTVKPRPFIDFIINKGARDKNLEVYWCEPTIAEQGSVTGLYNTTISNKKKWVLTFVCNIENINKGINAIKDSRQHGKWDADIVIMLPESLFNHPDVNRYATMLNVILRKLPERNFHTILDVWNTFPKNKRNIFSYNKFHVFDTFFKRWDYVVYVDTGSAIIKNIGQIYEFTPENCLYAYSTRDTKLIDQFDFNMISPNEKFKMSYTYDMSIDTFQTDVIIYDTRILQEDTVDRLFRLADMYPNSVNMDEGILNLYFSCEKNLWKKHLSLQCLNSN